LIRKKKQKSRHLTSSPSQENAKQKPTDKMTIKQQEAKKIKKAVPPSQNENMSEDDNSDQEDAPSDDEKSDGGQQKYKRWPIKPYFINRDDNDELWMAYALFKHNPKTTEESIKRLCYSVKHCIVNYTNNVKKLHTYRDRGSRLEGERIQNLMENMTTLRQSLLDTLGLQDKQ